MAERAEGEWTTLATGLENTGRYELPLTPTAPRCMYLRVEATDLAGNVGQAQTMNPIHLELPWQTTSAAPPAPVEVPKVQVQPEPRPSTVSVINLDVN